MRTVPGLFITPYGAALNKYFSHGFDCDHRTDIQIGVDDIPVNTATHTHGQGYADSHFR